VKNPYRPESRCSAAITSDSVQAEPWGESLVADARSGLTPADMVERKLVAILRGAPVASSLIRKKGKRHVGS
jgi:hypothetical protein